MILRYLKKITFLNEILLALLSLIATGIKPTLAVYAGVSLVLLALQFFINKGVRKLLFKQFIVWGGGQY